MRTFKKRNKGIRKFSPHEKFAICDLLLACGTLRDPESRATVLEMLEDEVPEVASRIKNSSTNRGHVMNIINACLKYSALGSLIKIIRGFEGKTSLPMQAIDEYLVRIRTQRYPQEYLEELERIIYELDISIVQLKNLYYVSIPFDWLPLQVENQQELLSAMIQNLAHSTDSKDKTDPLLEFAERIALDTRDAEERLGGWISKAAQFLQCEHIIESIRNKVRLEKHHASLSQSYLLVKLDPYAPDSKKFVLQAWFFCEGVEEQALNMGDEPYELDSLSKAFERLRLETGYCCARWISKKDPIIELFLPIELFGYDIDKWAVYLPPEQIPLNLRYPLVIRSLDRLYCADPHQRVEMRGLWEKKWGEFKKQIATLAPKFCDADYANAHYLRARLLHEIFLILTFIPPTVQSLSEIHLLPTMIKMGIPVALWPRRDPPNSAEYGLQELLQSLLTEDDLALLPETIFKKRHFLLDETQHPIHYLTLLWDDPNRLPPDLDVEESIYLRAPDRVRR